MIKIKKLNRRLEEIFSLTSISPKENKLKITTHKQLQLKTNYNSKTYGIIEPKL